MAAEQLCKVVLVDLMAEFLLRRRLSKGVHVLIHSLEEGFLRQTRNIG